MDVLRNVCKGKLPYVREIYVPNEDGVHRLDNERCVYVSIEGSAG